MMWIRGLLIAAIVAPAAAFQAVSPALRPQSRTHRAIAMQFPTPPNLDDETIYPKDADGKVLITFASVDKTGKEMIGMALDQRNRERILAGQPKYESIDAMIDAYMEFEGAKEGMSRAQCEDAVIRFLQRQAIMNEGGGDLKDPQTIVTFGLLVLLVVGAGFNIATGNVQI